MRNQGASDWHSKVWVEEPPSSLMPKGLTAEAYPMSLDSVLVQPGHPAFLCSSLDKYPPRPNSKGRNTLEARFSEVLWDGAAWICQLSGFTDKHVSSHPLSMPRSNVQLHLQ